jgi:hypothetical protein
MVLYSGQTPTSCGYGTAAAGPFYCPLDHKVYIDLSFYRALRSRFGAPGDFAQAYVIAHEVGHHVQRLMGVIDTSERSRERSIRIELMADCLAGVWAGSTRDRDLLDPGDIEEALGAAAAVGDDRIQQKSGGVVVPETWTHGSSEQRMEWFRRGVNATSLEECNTLR